MTSGPGSSESKYHLRRQRQVTECAQTATHRDLPENSNFPHHRPMASVMKYERSIFFILKEGSLHFIGGNKHLEFQAMPGEVPSKFSKTGQSVLRQCIEPTSQEQSQRRALTMRRSYHPLQFACRGVVSDPYARQTIRLLH